MTAKEWTRDELIAALNLYYKIPFSKLTSKNPMIKLLAGLIGRTPSAVTLKLVNFARLDPTLQQRNVTGMTHGSRQDKAVWEEFMDNIEELAFQSEIILAGLKKQSLEKSAEIDTEDLPAKGRERDAIVKTRVNQSFFRQTVLAAYDSRCCVTGISKPALLTASHIKPWAEDVKNRLNPRNGLCLNALHDRAFDRGLITVTPDLKLKVSRDLKQEKAAYSSFFEPYENVSILMPRRFPPDPEFLEWHNKNRFEKEVPELPGKPL